MGDSVDSENERTSTPAAVSLLDWPFRRLIIVLSLSAQVVGLLLLTGGNLATLALAFPIAVPAIAFCALALWKGKAWMFLGAGVTLALLPALLLSFAPAYVTSPQLGTIFAGAVLLLLSAALGLAAGVAVFRARKSGANPPSARAGLRTRAGLVSVLLVGLCLGAIVAGEAAYFNATAPSTSLAGADIAPEAFVNITVENYMFSPRNVSVPAGKLIEVTVVNKDGDFHTLTYAVNPGTAQEKRYNHDLLPSSTVKFLALFSSPGVVRLWCVPHDMSGMDGNFIVT